MILDRQIRKSPPGDTGHCYCGLRAAYVATVNYERKNRFGLRDVGTQRNNLCSIHGRVYASRHKLEVKP